MGNENLSQHLPSRSLDPWLHVGSAHSHIHSLSDWLNVYLLKKIEKTNLYCYVLKAVDGLIGSGCGDDALEEQRSLTGF